MWHVQDWIGQSGHPVLPMNVAILAGAASDAAVADAVALNSLPETRAAVIEVAAGYSAADIAGQVNVPEVDVVHIMFDHETWGGVLPPHPAGAARGVAATWRRAAGLMIRARPSAFWSLRYRIQKPVVLEPSTLAPLRDLLAADPVWGRLPALARAALAARYQVEIENAPFVTGIVIARTPNDRDLLIARGVKPAYAIVVDSGSADNGTGDAGWRATRAVALRGVYARAIEVYAALTHGTPISAPASGRCA